MENRIENLEEIVKLQYEIIKSLIHGNDLYGGIDVYNKTERIKELLEKMKQNGRVDKP